MNNVNQLYSKYFDTYKKNYDSEDLNEEDKNIFDPIQFKIFGKNKIKTNVHWRKYWERYAQTTMD